MKHYTHKPVEIQKLTTQTINFKRFYQAPNGILYPSITTVLSTRKKEGLFEWRKKVGDEVANYVARVSANRGTAVHHMCEDYLNNYPIDWPDKWKEHEKKFLPYCLFKQLKKTVLEKIHTKERTDEYNENYYIQAAAYAEMFEEQTGTPIEQIVILVVTEDGVVQEFVKNKYDYIPLLVESIDNFTKDWEEENDKLDRTG